MLLLLIVLFNVVTTLSNFKATLPLISPIVYWNTCTKFHHISQKNMTKNFWYQNQNGLLGGMMLWIMSGTFKNFLYIIKSRNSLAHSCRQRRQNYVLSELRAISLENINGEIVYTLNH